MLSEESIGAVDRWLGSAVCHFFPGALILDYAFGKGLFSVPPSTVYEFLLFLLHSAALSFLFVYVAQTGMQANLGAETAEKLSSYEVGIMCVPLVVWMTLIVIFCGFIFERIGQFNPISVGPSQALLVNTCLSFAVMFLLSPPSCKLYFGWYRQNFTGHSAKPQSDL